MLNLLWRKQARDDLNGIAAYVAEWNEAAADQLVNRIEEAALSLLDFPYRGQSGRQAGTRELLAHPNYWLIYRVRLDCIEIATILHTRQEYP